MKILWFVLFVLFIEPIQAVTKNVHVEKPGTFVNLVSEEEKFEIEKLVVSGNLNGSDIKIIREMAGCEDYSLDPIYKMTDLDLSDANIVSGGDCYLKFINETHYTINNQIGQRMFQSSRLQSIKLPKSTLSIEAYAFQLSKSLTTINIPDGVVIIGVSAFKSCSALKILELPESISKIEAFSFENCSNLKTIALPLNLKEIGGFSFKSCVALTSIVIPDQITSIAPALFQDCIALKEITFPEAMTTIMNSAFENCCALEKIYLPEAISHIREKAFAGCSKLCGIDITRKIPPYCDEFAFLGINSSCVINVPYGSKDAYVASAAWGVFDIREKNDEGDGDANSGEVEGEDYSFWINHSDGHTYYLRYLSTVPPFMVSLERKNKNEHEYKGDILIPETVRFRNIDWKITEVGATAFTDCKELKSVVFNKYIENIMPSCFYGCDNLDVIEVDSENKRYYSQDGVLYDKINLSLVRCPSGKKTLLEIPESIEVIENGACEKCRIDDVVIPNSIRVIGDFAFWGCGNIKDIVIPESVIEIGNNAFYCDNLKSVHVMSENPPAVYDYSFMYFNAVLYVPKNCIDVYAKNQKWNQFKDIKEEGDVANKKLDVIADDIQISTQANGVLIKTISDRSVFIYTVDGKFIRSINIVSENFVSLPKGIYVLASGFDRLKFMIK